MAVLTFLVSGSKTKRLNGCGGPHDPLWEALYDELILALPDPKDKKNWAPDLARPEPPRLTLPDHIAQMFAAKKAAEEKPKEDSHE